MFRKILTAFGVLLLLFIAVILFNIFRTKPWPTRQANMHPDTLPDSAIQHMSQAIQIPTVSVSDSVAADSAVFRSFGAFLERAYPLVHQHLSKTMTGQLSFVFEWKGANPSLKPIILMGHYDVVPVEASALDKWVMPPFSGAVTDTCIWGRGSSDDKSGVISIMEAAEAMLHKGFVPQRTIYLCFGHDEEISGRGARAIVQYLQQKNVHAEMVLDEGGEITEEKARELQRPLAAIGVAEKGYASYELTVEKEGGHSSKPVRETAIDILVTALHRLRDKETPIHITPTVREFLQRVGPSSHVFINKMAASNMWLFEGMSKKVISSQPEGNAMLRTTIVPTIIEGGIKDNVIPTVAKAIVNSRILTGETWQTVQEYIVETIHDDRVKVKKIGQMDSDPSAATSTSSPAFKRIENAVYETVPNVLPAPYLMIGATDSRHYRSIADGVVNFLPTTDSKGFHGINERIMIRDLQRAINFMKTIIEESNREFMSPTGDED